MFFLGGVEMRFKQRIFPGRLMGVIGPASDTLHEIGFPGEARSSVLQAAPLEPVCL